MSIPVYDWIRFHAEGQPGKLAAVDVESGRRLTYAQFNDRVTRLARGLSEQVAADASDRASLFEDFQKRRVQRVQRVHGLTLRAARLDLEPESGADLSLLMSQLSQTIAQPA